MTSLTDADRIATDFATIRFEGHEARRLALAYFDLKRDLVRERERADAAEQSSRDAMDDLTLTQQDLAEEKAERGRKERLLQMILDDNHLLSSADDWEKLAIRHIVTARAALLGRTETQ